jgi:hypothetical protein
MIITRSRPSGENLSVVVLILAAIYELRPLAIPAGLTTLILVLATLMQRVLPDAIEASDLRMWP